MKQRITFIHIPKVAGNAIQNCVYDANELADKKYIITYKKNRRRRIGHYSYQRLIRKNGFFHFAFIREPYDRFYSAYSFFKYMTPAQKIFNRGHNKEIHNHINSNYNTFEEFANTFHQDKFICKQHVFKRQCDWLYHEEHIKDIDFIGRYENLEKDMGRLLDLLDLPQVKLEKVNVSNKKKCFSLSLYTQEMRDNVYNYYDYDFLEYGYKK